MARSLAQELKYEDVGINIRRLQWLTIIARKEAREDPKEIESRKKAREIIEQIESIAEEYAKEGKNYAVVAKAGSWDENFNYYCTDEEFDPNQLKGTFKYVYDYCKSVNLKPTVEFVKSHGLNSFMKIVIHW